MKKITSLGMLVLSLSLLTACGGGDESSASVSTPTTPSSTPTTTPVSGASTGDLIIDNGRGTSNNQDTETAKD